VLHNGLDCLITEPEGIVLNEAPTNLREITSAAIAMVTPFAAQRGVGLRERIGANVIDLILADSLRLRQMLIALLSHVVQFSSRTQVEMIVAAEWTTRASQRISFTCIESGDARRPFERTSAAILESVAPDALLHACRILAQRMNGELILTKPEVGGHPHPPFRAVFAAAFTLERLSQVSSFPPCTGLNESELKQVGPEPFEQRYLDALSQEGVDLPTFLASWCQAMHDDLQHLDALLEKGDYAGLSTRLHRLSGAVGLVGAHSLTDALRRASAAPKHSRIESIRALAERTRNLVTQIESAARPYRSN
jgi:HPt (histidine-containing phosphotransfer) domain-containing protein